MEPHNKNINEILYEIRRLINQDGDESLKYAGIAIMARRIEGIAKSASCKVVDVMLVCRNCGHQIGYDSFGECRHVRKQDEYSSICWECDCNRPVESWD